MQHNEHVLVSWVRIRTQLVASPILVLWLAVPVQCSMLAREPEPEWVKPLAPAKPKDEVVPPQRETLNGHKKPIPPLTLPDEVVVHVMDAGRVAFVRCFKKAYDVDPSTTSYKVRLHVELDAGGTVTGASTDAEAPALSECLARIARVLPYPAPGKAAVVDLPLFWRPQ